MGNFYKTSKYIKIKFITPDTACSWFGYYNYDPIDKTHTKLLCHRLKEDGVIIDKNKTVEIGYYNLFSGNWIHIAESNSFNWQQGAMTQWLPICDNKIIFNDSCNNKHISRIINIATGEEKRIDWPIYGITPDGKKSIALDMERQHWCRGYHYESVADISKEGNIIDGDGIFEVDLEHNIRKLLIDIKDVIQIDKEEYFDNAKHWLEHIMISPKGKYFCFLHRFTIGSLDDYETRLFIAKIDGTELKIVKGWRNFYWSHFGWCGDDIFTIYAYNVGQRKKTLENLTKDVSTLNRLEAIKRKIRSFYHLLPENIRKEYSIWRNGMQTYYQMYRITDDDIDHIYDLKLRLFDIDGHPSFTNDMKYMITDSYPDSYGYQRLIVYSVDSKKAIVVGKFFAGLYKKNRFM